MCYDTPMINEYGVEIEPNPFLQFQKWYQIAEDLSEIPLADACCLSTISPDGYPEGRMVLLKRFDERGAVFFTNSQSNKGLSLQKVPRASLTFHWHPLGYQVRIQGDVEALSEAESDAYFETRSKESQIGAWVSQQSRERTRPLKERVIEFEKSLGDEDRILRPSHWGGYCVVPRRIIFWIEREHRLHDGFVFTRTGNDWTVQSVDP